MVTMPDRYDEGIDALHGTPAPDQWDEIERRSQAGTTVPLNGNGGPTRRRWPTVLAVAAAVLLVAGGLALAVRDEDGVTMQPATSTESTPTTDDTQDTAESPGGTTTVPPSTTEATAPTTTGGEAPSRPVACPATVSLATTTAPEGWSGTMVPANPGDPRIPDVVWSEFPVPGVFPGTTTTRAVFVVAGLPNLVDDAFTRTPGPVPGTEVAIAPYPDGAIAELPVAAPPGEACWVTLIAIGMTEDDLRTFVGGLTTI
jgi:hypothetical protein